MTTGGFPPSQSPLAAPQRAPQGPRPGPNRPPGLSPFAGMGTRRREAPAAAATPFAQPRPQRPRAAGASGWPQAPEVTGTTASPPLASPPLASPPLASPVATLDPNTTLNATMDMLFGGPR